MSNDSQKIQFNSTKLNLLKSNIHNVEALSYQFEIFTHMTSYLRKYLDLELENIKFLIHQSAQLWQDAHSIPLSHFTTSLPQERLIMAEQFKIEAFKVFGGNLRNSQDLENLKAVIEHALMYYMKEFATR